MFSIFRDRKQRASSEAFPFDWQLTWTYRVLKRNLILYHEFPRKKGEIVRGSHLQVVEGGMQNRYSSKSENLPKWTYRVLRMSPSCMVGLALAVAVI